MSHLAIYLLALAALRPASALGVGLQDLASLPKYQVDFLNDLPLSESDAASIRIHGLTHEDQFLALHPASARRDTIESTTSQSSTDILQPGEPNSPAGQITLVPMLYTHPSTESGPHSYLCAMPSVNTTMAQTVQEALDEPEPDPEESWRALSHLDGQCLYLRIPHSWFAYAYCHNKDIRQFREKPVPHPHPEDFVPQEDPEYDGYTLGVAQPRKSASDAVQRAEATASFGQSHASRYLVQRWTGGTRCDLTGKPREIEVQVYCSMTGTDMIYMVNEVAICQYVMVIHSPHLCSLPGFRPATAADITPAPVRCREIVPDDDFAEWSERRDHPRIGEVMKEVAEVDARLASQEEDPELKIDGLKGVSISKEDLSAILQAAFGGIAKKREEVADAEVEQEMEEEADQPATGAKDKATPDLYVVNMDGVRVPVDIESVPPSEEESRRATRREFMKQLHAQIEKELGIGLADKESEPTSERAEQASGTGLEDPQDAPPIQRDEL
ncbi:hypothetical protein CcaverHIS002_0405010 [Cutaneotrichosporon cavernicola]|nr:hypothetical protein CcaverHIS002_0405010 [Cutaneotrichosporon cavernicola]